MNGEAADQVLQRHESQNPEPYQILQMVVDQILGTMTPLQRQIVELRIEGCSVPEIAESTGRSKRTVERVLQGFREQLSSRIALKTTPTKHDERLSESTPGVDCRSL
ncbi:MAG: sigma factor-like helix-turn-helix DNA-binding protein [Pirellulaceae bacterium]